MYDFYSDTFRQFNHLAPSPTAPRIIGLSGYARSGKDTVAGLIHHLYGHTVLSYSDVLREVLYAQDLYLPDGKRLNVLVDAYGWEETRERYPYIRSLQQKTGTEAVRNILGDTSWVDAWNKRTTEGLWVNPSIRFPNEAESVLALGGVILRVNRPGVEAVNDHPSDSALDGWPWHSVIENDGSLLDLEGEIQRVLGDLG